MGEEERFKFIIFHVKFLQFIPIMRILVCILVRCMDAQSRFTKNQRSREIIRFFNARCNLLQTDGNENITKGIAKIWKSIIYTFKGICIGKQGISITISVVSGTISN